MKTYVVMECVERNLKGGDRWKILGETPAISESQAKYRFKCDQGTDAFAFAPDDLRKR